VFCAGVDFDAARKHLLFPQLVFWDTVFDR